MMTAFPRMQNLALRSALRQLPHNLRLVLILRFWKQQSMASISQALALKAKDVESLLNQGLALLKNDPLIRLTNCNQLLNGGR